jgi:ABC-2 type transport system ATP-binding protein
VRVTFSAGEADVSWLSGVPHVRQVKRQGPVVEAAGDGPVAVMVATALVQHGLTPADLRTEQSTLEDVFLKLTGSGMGN